jgi:Amiloride-sensitive sodium channel
MVVLVHDNMAVPLMDVFGLNLIPGRKHKLSYRKKATYFLPAPYTSCANTDQQSMKAISANYPSADYRYSQVLCFRMSAQSYT